MEQITYKNIEKHVMSYIILHKPNLCNFTSIYNDFLTDIFNITDNQQLLKIEPNVLKLLKIRLGTVMMYLDSNQENVSVIKNQNSYLVGYAVEDDDTPNIDIKTDFPSEQDIFEHIVDDNNVIYRQNLITCNGDTLLHYGALYNDLPRIEKIINTHKLSFYTKNNNNITPIDMAADNNHILKKVLDEHYTDILRLNAENQTLMFETNTLKFEMNTLKFEMNTITLSTHSLHREVQSLKSEIYKLTKQNTHLTFMQYFILIFYILIIFIFCIYNLL